MDKVDPYQSQCRGTYEPHKVMMVDPNNGDEQVAHRIADGRGPQRPRAENAGCSGALSSSTMMVTITAKTPSENAVSRSAVIFSSCIARWPFDSNEILCVLRIVDPRTNWYQAFTGSAGNDTGSW